MPRGGRRQGTPGKGYSNRTDLGLQPNMGMNTAATGGMQAPVSHGGTSAPQGQAPAMTGPLVGTDEIPNLSDPSLRPHEPLMAGVPIGDGPGREALGILPPGPADPVRQMLEALSLTYSNPDIVRALAQMDYEGR
jgi:hypothetical protein